MSTPTHLVPTKSNLDNLIAMGIDMADRLDKARKKLDWKETDLVTAREEYATIQAQWYEHTAEEEYIRNYLVKNQGDLELETLSKKESPASKTEDFLQDKCSPSLSQQSSIQT